MAVWTKRNSDLALKPTDVENSAGFPHLIGQFLSSRGVDSTNLDALLNPKLSSLKDPSLLFDMDTSYLV